MQEITLRIGFGNQIWNLTAYQRKGKLALLKLT